MDGGSLSADQVAPRLSSPDPADREIASWIVGRHPEWAGALADSFRRRLNDAGSLSEADREALTDQLARFARDRSVQDLLAENLLGGRPTESVRVALAAIARSGVKDVPKVWVDGLTAVLMNAQTPAAVSSEAVAAARALPLAREKAGKLASELTRIGTDESVPPAARLDALAAVPGGPVSVSPRLFAFLLAQVDPEKPVALRSAAANVLARANLTGEQLLALTDAVKAAGPLEVDKLLSAFEKTKDDAVGLRLVDAVQHASALASLRVEMLKPRFDRFGPRVRGQAEEVYARLNVGAAEQKARLESLLPTLTGGDVRRGQAVFNGPKAACITCHAVGYLGGQVGPDLTRIGQLRTDRDLVESILYPSLSFVRSYEPVTVATRQGKVLNGLLKKDSADEVVLTVSATEHAHIPRDDVEEMRPGTVSIMPAGLDQQLTRQELADLLAFLRSRK